MSAKEGDHNLPVVTATEAQLDRWVCDAVAEERRAVIRWLKALGLHGAADGIKALEHHAGARRWPR